MKSLWTGSALYSILSNNGDAYRNNIQSNQNQRDFLLFPYTLAPYTLSIGVSICFGDMVPSWRVVGANNYSATSYFCSAVTVQAFSKEWWVLITVPARCSSSVGGYNRISMPQVMWDWIKLKVQYGAKLKMTITLENEPRTKVV
jgi:hypothetical protein